MNIIRAFMSQLYGLARIDAAFNNQSLKTIHSSNVILGFFSFCVRGGVGGFEPMWFNDSKLPISMVWDVFPPLRYSARSNF